MGGFIRSYEISPTDERRGSSAYPYKLRIDMECDGGFLQVLEMLFRSQAVGNAPETQTHRRHREPQREPERALPSARRALPPGPVIIDAVFEEDDE